MILMIVDVNLKSEPFLKVEQFEIVYANINSSGNSTQLIECEIATIVSMSFKFRCRQLLLHLLLIRRRKKFTRKPNQKKVEIDSLFASFSFHFTFFAFTFYLNFCSVRFPAQQSTRNCELPFMLISRFQLPNEIRI